jgi:hypothetical protein
VEPPDLDHIQAVRQASVHQAVERGLVLHRTYSTISAGSTLTESPLDSHSSEARTESLRRRARRIS